MCIDSTSESSCQTVQHVNGQWYEELGKYVSNSRDSLDRAALKQDVMFTVFFTVACGHSNLYSIRSAYCRSVVVVVAVPNLATSESTNVDIAKRRSSASKIGTSSLPTPIGSIPPSLDSLVPHKDSGRQERAGQPHSKIVSQ